MKKGLVQPRSPKGSPPEGMAQPEDGDRNEWQREAGEGRKRKKGAGPSGIRGARWASGDLSHGKVSVVVELEEMMCVLHSAQLT